MFKIINKNTPTVVDCDNQELYQYRVYIGKNTVLTDRRCSYWYVDEDRVVSTSGTGESFVSNYMCVEIFGYTPETRTSTFNKGTDLPYINGCSTKQLINASRAGDPTFQYLLIPAGTSEQQHHIHATPRVVYVAQGQGRSIVGTPGKKTEYELNEGDVILLGKMIPHHFETQDRDLIVLPVHVFSSVGQQEFNHPMYVGTHRI